jgi:phosphohistidine phosphatase
MMKRLYIVRHGIAVPPGTPDYEDDDRPLTPKGEKRTLQVARGLRRLGTKLDRIVTSPLPRAAKTAEITAEVLGLTDRLEADDALRAGQTADAIRDWLESREEDRLMIVGHNPAFEELVGLLAIGTAHSLGELRKGGVAAFATRADRGFALDWLATPGLLRRLQ